MSTTFWGKNLLFLRKKENLNQSEMSAQLGFQLSQYNNWEKNNKFPNISDFLKICKHFGVSETDFLHTDLSNVHLNSNLVGEKRGKNVHLNVHPSVHLKGQTPVVSAVFEDQAPYFRMPKVITVDSRDQENVLLLPVKARAGYLNGYEDADFIANLPAYRLPGLNNGTFRLFEVDGISMYPTLNDKDVVITKFIENLNEIRDDRLYVILTKNDGVVVKRVLNRLQKDGKLILKSDNYKDRDLYPNLVIPPEEVLEVWYATSFISYQMRPPSEMYNRVIDLEGRLTIMEDRLKKAPPKRK